jgi:hypothetical protein
MIEELKARMARTLDEWRDFEPEDDWSGYQRDHKLALSALSAVPVMKEALGNAYETLSIIADAADEDQVKLAAREATTGISQALAALEPKP